MQTGKLTADGPITALSWNLEGTRLLTGGKILQLWHQASLYQDDSQRKNSKQYLHVVISNRLRLHVNFTQITDNYITSNGITS